MVMIENANTGEVLVQNRTGKWPGWTFPGGKIEPGESLYECAVREIYEETGLAVCNLKYCGTVHWEDAHDGSRYLCFMYTTQEYEGELVLAFDKGQNFWYAKSAMLKAEEGKFNQERVDYMRIFYDESFTEAYMTYSNGQGRDVKTFGRCGKALK